MDKQYDRTMVERIRNEVNILDVISDYVLLNQKGRYYIGLCPFHQEKSPSFTVTPDKQIFHCFGCGEGGDLFSFLMKKESITFGEAVIRLAARANIPLPETSSGREYQSKLQNRANIYDINRLAARFFYLRLTKGQDGKDAVKYLLGRGIKGETIKKFGLGYAPHRWADLRNYLLSQGYNEKMLEQAGLVVASSKGKGYFDRFRDRIIFPIIDAQGKVSGFGGRIVNNGNPKYLNSPETIVFNKGKNLYGIHLAKEKIIEQGKVVLVEGYMDVLMAHQAGCNVVVGSLGTALTPDQCRLLSSMAGELILLYDGDSAGGRAALKGINLLKQYNLNVKICPLPKDLDPADYIVRYGDEQFLDLLEKSVPYYDFQLQTTLQGHTDDSPGGKLKAVKLIIPVLLSIDNITEREEYIKSIARQLELSEENLRLQLRQAYINQANSEPKGVNFSKNRHTIRGMPSRQVLEAPYGMQTAPVKAQQELLKLIIADSRYLDYLTRELSPDCFTVPVYQEILSVLSQIRETQGHVQTSTPLSSLSEEGKKVYAELLTIDNQGIEWNERVVLDYIKCLQEDKIQQEILGLQKAIEECEREGRQEELLELLSSLQHLKRSSNISSNR